MPELYMHGPEIFSFSLRVVPDIVTRVLSIASLTLADIDLFVFHQANQYMLDHLRKKMNIPTEKFCLKIRDCGNTVSSTIPIAIKDCLNAGELYNQQRVMVVGFGVGYSWAAGILRWNNS